MIGSDLVYAKQQLELGLTVGIPTETVYGLAGNALNEAAVLSIFKIKNRPFFDPLIVHVSNLESVKKFTLTIPEKAEKLAKAFWPGPLTLLLPKNNFVPSLVTSGSDYVAVRVPDHPMTLELLNILDFPLAAPSANPFGYISPTRAEHVEQQLGAKVSYILDGGISNVGIESTIVDCNGPVVKVLRLGGLSIERIESELGEKVELMVHTNSDPQAPGQLDKHYSPESAFVLTDDIDREILVNKGKQISVLVFGEVKVPNDVFSLNLSPSGNIDEAALNLFHYMRLLDKLKSDLIIAMRVPAIGLGLAINDRLTRAASKFVKQ
ncbi:MAG TPA: L-threonylcarbamoyladenylate synthase [Bacteroidia bacterium]